MLTYLPLSWPDTIPNIFFGVSLWTSNESRLENDMSYSHTIISPQNNSMMLSNVKCDHISNWLVWTSAQPHLKLMKKFPGIDIVNTFRTVILWLLSAPWSLTMPLLRANIIPLLSFSCRYWLTGLYSSLKQLQEYILFCSPLRAFAPWSLKDLNIYFPSDFSTIPLRQMISCDLSLLLRLWSLSYPGSISAFVVLQSNTTACHTCIVCILDI